ncbi:MAG: hypothetical protein AB7U51_09685 [Arcobacter sp.]|uniref:hypothetical protein n=1 Tax=Arcobacter sp. TaxID=1872629 RepID=UPI003D04F3A4
MENQKDYKSEIFANIEKISNEVLILKSKYNKFFNIEEIFSSENGGKTRLNRQIFNENHENIQSSILEISLSLDEIIGLIKEQMRVVLNNNNQFEKAELNTLIFDDKNFLEILSLDLDTHGIKGEAKKRCLNEIKELINLKNKVFNLRYFIDMFDTTIFDKYINRLGVEDLINSTIIFEIIDSYALQFEEVKKFTEQLTTLGTESQKITNLNSINSLLELHKRRVDNYMYAGIKYKIFIEYNCEININKPVYLNMAYIENILSAIIEQSSMDVVKKELKKGKIQKQIDVNISLNKNLFQMVVKNNGFEVRNIYNLFLSDIDNKNILEAKNLANSLNAKFDITSIDNEGMLYSLVLKSKD